MQCEVARGGACMAGTMHTLPVALNDAQATTLATTQ